MVIFRNDFDTVECLVPPVSAKDNPLDPRVKKRKLLSSAETSTPLEESSDTTSKESIKKDCYEFEPAELYSNQREVIHLMSENSINSSIRCATRRARFSPTFDFSILKNRR